MEKNCTAKVTNLKENPERREEASEHNIPLIDGYTPEGCKANVVIEVTYICIGKCPDSGAVGGFVPCPSGGSVDLSRDIPISNLVTEREKNALDDAHKAYRSDSDMPSDQGTTHTGTSSQKLLDRLYGKEIPAKIKRDSDNKGPLFQELQTELADWNLCKCKITKTVKEKNRMSGMDRDNKNRAYKRNRY
tara:strand:- start:187 stop:756 length:570 start_codon:yes stop_codon:yes gene_type:complete